MIEITQAGPKHDEKTKIKGKKKSHGIGKAESAFATELKSAVTFDLDGGVDDLLEDLQDQEKRFMDLQSEYELMKYKAMVQKILKKILDQGFKTQTLKRPPSKSGKAEHTIIKEIDERLLAISQAITRRNRAFNLMKSIEEIRGLILDLVY